MTLFGLNLFSVRPALPRAIYPQKSYENPIIPNTVEFRSKTEISKRHWGQKDVVRGIRYKGKKLNKGDKMPLKSVLNLVLGDGKGN